MAKTAFGEEEDPTSRYQNPRYSGKKSIKYSDMSVEKIKPSGAYRVSHFQDGYLNSKQYVGYTKKQAMKKHKDQYEGGK